MTSQSKYKDIRELMKKRNKEVYTLCDILHIDRSIIDDQCDLIQDLQNHMGETLAPPKVFIGSSIYKTNGIRVSNLLNILYDKIILTLCSSISNTD